MGFTGQIDAAKNLVSGQPDALLELLLELSNKKVYNRIQQCPTYPLSDSDEELSNPLAQLRKIIEENPGQLPEVLGVLYQQAVSRSSRKKQGQFFIPQGTANWITNTINFGRDDTVLDPGCGTGAFAVSCNEVEQGTSELGYIGVEDDPILALASSLVLDALDAPPRWIVIYSNFFNISIDLIKKTEATLPNRVISNPPFIRFHRTGTRETLVKRIKNKTGLEISGYAGTHIFFLAQSFLLLEDVRTSENNGEWSITILFPSEIGSTDYSIDLFEQIRTKLDWGYSSIDVEDEINQSAIDIELDSSQISEIYYFSPSETMPDQPEQFTKSSTLLDTVANVQRGISTGANEFFTLTDDEVDKMDVSERFREKIIPTKINIESDEITSELWEGYRNQGQKCWLLSISENRQMEELPPKLKNYLEKGIADGVHMRTTCARRSTWYSVPIPESSPDIVFTYVSQGDPRFVYNNIDAYALTNLLSINLNYTTIDSTQDVKELVVALNTQLEQWIRQDDVGRHYDRGLFKIEPGELGKMPVNDELRELLDPGHRTLGSFS